MRGGRIVHEVGSMAFDGSGRVRGGALVCAMCTLQQACGVAANGTLKGSATAAVCRHDPCLGLSGNGCGTAVRLVAQSGLVVGAVRGCYVSTQCGVQLIYLLVWYTIATLSAKCSLTPCPHCGDVSPPEKYSVLALQPGLLGFGPPDSFP